MSLEDIILVAGAVCFMICIVAQRVYIQMLEQKIERMRSESVLWCGDCDHAEYIFKEIR